MTTDSSGRATTENNENNENKTEEDKQENGHIDLVKTEIIINTMTTSEDAETNVCRV